MNFRYIFFLRIIEPENERKIPFLVSFNKSLYQAFAMEIEQEVFWKRIIAGFFFLIAFFHLSFHKHTECRVSFIFELSPPTAHEFWKIKIDVIVSSVEKRVDKNHYRYVCQRIEIFIERFFRQIAHSKAEHFSYEYPCVSFHHKRKIFRRYEDSFMLSCVVSSKERRWRKIRYFCKIPHSEAGRWGNLSMGTILYEIEHGIVYI